MELKSIGPIAFGPQGVLFVSDPLEATVYAVETQDITKPEKPGELKIENIVQSIAGMLGVEKEKVRINDLAVNPISQNAYLSITRGSGEEAVAAILKVNASNGKIELFDHGKAKYTKSKLPNPATGKGRRGQNQKMSSITDLTFIDGELYVAGLSNEEFASNLRSIPFPFEKTSEGASIEIYHGAHGRFETQAPIRTFAAYDVAGETNLLAAYTCTPLVRIPISNLKPESKVKGTTVAELGNRNRPLDMVVYKKGGKDYVLMANSSRGVMKIQLDEIEKQVGLTQRVAGGGTAGLKYETIKTLTGVTQLDGVDGKRAMVIVKDDNGNFHLKTIEMP
jgi:hypothetical protein